MRLSLPGVPPANTWANAPVGMTRSGETTPALGSELPEREAGEALRAGVRQAQRQAEVLGQVQEDVEELRLESDGVEVSIEMAHVETPVDGTFELSPALPAHLVEISVLPEVGCRPREAAIAVEQGRRVGDRPPAVQIVLGVERETNADVLSPVLCRSVSRPGCRDHERRRRGRRVAERLVDRDVPGMEHPELCAAQHEHAVVGVVAESLNKCGHRIDGSRSALDSQPSSGSLCRVTAHEADGPLAATTKVAH